MLDLVATAGARGDLSTVFRGFGNYRPLSILCLASVRAVDSFKNHFDKILRFLTAFFREDDLEITPDVLTN